MEIKKDLVGNTPQIGQILVYNPPYYKGLRLAYIIGFAKSGLPYIVDIDDLDEEEGNNYEEKLANYKKDYADDFTGDTPKTGFVVVNLSPLYEVY